MPRFDDDDDDDRPRRRRPRYDEDDDYDDRPRRRKKPAGPSAGLIIGVVGGVGLLVLVVCGGLLVPFVRGVKEGVERAAEADAIKQAAVADNHGLAEARAGFQSKLRVPPGRRTPPPPPPPGVFTLVKYDAPNGPTPAYLTPDPKGGQKRPAIVWITGGDCNSIDDGVFAEGPAENDQSAAAFRKAGLVMLFPSLRGGNDSPGRKEGFFGEVDDVIAAGNYLAKQPHVDPARVYLGGHSTGGTLVLLTAACTDRFRAVFSFGPADDVSAYPAEFTPFDTSDPKEVLLRSPANWLHSVKVPTFVIEGMTDGNLEALRSMQRASSNPKLSFLPVRGADHFSVLAPANRLLATKVKADTGPACGITLTETELSIAMRR